MKYEEAIEIIKRGGAVKRAGRTFRLLRGGIHDVTDAAAPVLVRLTDGDRSATDWERPEP